MKKINFVGTLIEAAKSGSARFIGRSRSEDSVCNTPGGNIRESISNSNSPASEEAITESPTDSNPSLDRPDIESSQEQPTEKNHHPPKEKEHHHHHHFHG